MKRWAEGLYVVPFIGLTVASGLGPPVAASTTMSAVSAGGLAVGMLWQALNRKDLADRLLWLAAIFAIGVLFQILTSLGSGSGELRISGLLFMCGATSGVVLAEAALRKRERSRGSDAREVTKVGVEGPPSAS